MFVGRSGGYTIFVVKAFALPRGLFGGGKNQDIPGVCSSQKLSAGPARSTHAGGASAPPKELLYQMY